VVVWNVSKHLFVIDECDGRMCAGGYGGNSVFECEVLAVSGVEDIKGFS
jgi:hypothetical protein